MLSSSGFTRPVGLGHRETLPPPVAEAALADALGLFGNLGWLSPARLVDANADLAPLLTAPRLQGLDLSQAVVQDLTVLAGLPQLRYVALTGGQWAVLLDGGKVPPTPAAARLAGRDVPRAEALAWEKPLGLPAGAPFAVSGTLAADGGADRAE
ncbi:hypothetical protein ABZW10_13095 [Kitasatospora sp. NPDC004723]|uniref:hypothetical protein n=1 Tax=Kitasatospora sp. NPDC004723 TaxID=3154288 RepID=UPI0033A7CBF6